LYRSDAHRDPHSFPTRRSSDLGSRLLGRGIAATIVVDGDIAKARSGQESVAKDSLALELIDAREATVVEDVGSELGDRRVQPARSEEHTSELQSPYELVCRLLL